MANIKTFDPFFELSRSDPLRDLEDFVGRSPRWLQLRDFEARPQIRIDVSEEDKAYRVKAEIPGAKKEDIQVSIEGNLVSLSAEIKEEKEEKGKEVLRRERYYGRQQRSFTLPQPVDEAMAEAKYIDGVLELTLPKKTDTAARKLKVQ